MRSLPLNSPQAIRALRIPVLPLLMSLTILGPVGPVTGDPLFASKVDYGTGTSPYSVAIGDVNGDGKPDLVAANLGSNTVSVLLGNGGGTFQARVDYGTGRSPISVAIGDVNGDAKLDLVTANRDSHTLSILLGNGDGTFQTKVDYGTGDTPNAVAVGEVSGDGKLDLAATNYFSNSASVLLGNGDGTFQTQVAYETLGPPVAVALGDVSGDGRVDMIATNFGSFFFPYHQVSVFLGNGDGTFQAHVDYATGDNPTSVAIGDLSGDGKADLAVTAYSSRFFPGTAIVSILLGNGDGTFQFPADYETGSNPGSVAIGDMNGDGKLDLVTANSSGTVSVFLGHGDGTFLAKDDYETGPGPHSVAIADVNGDGKLDLATANSDSTGSLSVLLNIGERATTLVASLDLEPNVINLKSHGPWVTAYLQSSEFDPTSIDLSTVRLAGSVTAAPKFAAVGDHDGNGMPDLMLKFSRSALDPLLNPGMNSLEITGTLMTGESFAGTDQVRVIDNGGGDQAVSVAPNPLNPSGILSFSVGQPGPVRIAMFDLQGRLVRTLIENEYLPTGGHEVIIDGRGERGEALPSGVYFYRVNSVGESVTGRFAILK